MHASIFILSISVALLFFYIDQYFHTHFASSHSYTRPHFRAFHLFDTWSYAILFSSFLIVLSIITKDRFRDLFVVLILACTSVFNIAFIGVNSGYYFPWNLITTESDHWLMQWGFNLLVNIQWMLFLIGVVKNRKFTLSLIPLGAALIAISSLSRNEIQRLFDIGATPIEVAYGVTLFLLSTFTTAYLVYWRKKQFIPAVVQAIIVNVFFANIGIVAWYAPRIHRAVPIFIFERDLCLVSILFATVASFFASKVIAESSFVIKKYLIAAATVIVLLLPVLGYVQYRGRDNVIVEYIGGKYEARIRLISLAGREDFYYVKGGEGYSGIHACMQVIMM